jgi:putative membrane protein
MMSTRLVIAALLSALHLLTLALGLGAVIWRNRGFIQLDPHGNGDRDGAGARDWHDTLQADTVWGIAAALWVTTGLARVFIGSQSPAFYAHNGFFWIKMALFVAIFAIELMPMIALLRVRSALRRGLAPPSLPLARFRRIGMIETALVIIMVFVAAFMARGAWLF